MFQGFSCLKCSSRGSKGELKDALLEEFQERFRGVSEDCIGILVDCKLFKGALQDVSGSFMGFRDVSRAFYGCCMGLGALLERSGSFSDISDIF